MSYPDKRQTGLKVDNRNHNEHRSHITHKNTSRTGVVDDFVNYQQSFVRSTNPDYRQMVLVVDNHNKDGHYMTQKSEFGVVECGKKNSEDH
nr:hypothetical protein [Tanacetum cinerariifolium]